MKTITVRTTKKELIQQLKQLPKEITGRRSGSELQKVFFNHLTHAVYTGISKAYEAKSDGGTDEFGTKWQPLKPETIAARPITKTEYRKAGVKPGERGILTAMQNAIWKGIFAATFKRAKKEYPEAEAKTIAGKTAWAVIKSLGGKTLLGTFGRRKVPILRVSDRLYDSLSPGKLTNNRYYPPTEQVANQEGNTLVLGTEVPYAKNVAKKRPIMPSASKMQSTGFLLRCVREATRGLVGQLETFLRKSDRNAYRRYRKNR